MPSRRPSAADVVTSLAAFSKKVSGIKVQESASISPPSVENPRPVEPQDISLSDFDIPAAPVTNSTRKPAPVPHMPSTFSAPNAELYLNMAQNNARNCCDTVSESTRKMVAAVRGATKSLKKKIKIKHRAPPVGTTSAERMEVKNDARHRFAFHPNGSLSAPK